MRLLLMVSILSLLFGCSKQDEVHRFFPLNEDAKWVYAVSETDETGTRNSTFTIEGLGAKKLSKADEGLATFARQTSDGTDYHYVSDEAGVHLVAKRTIVELKPRLLKQARRVLPAVDDIAVGRFWNHETQPYMLHATSFHSIPDPSKKAFLMAYEVIETDAKVRVPAGDFDNVVLVEGTGVISIYADPRLGYQDVEITQREWYAPHVGLVKLVRSEPLTLELFQGGEVEFLLERFEN